MTFFRKAYSVACVVLMIQFVAQLYFVAAAILTIFQADDNAEDVYSAFKTADTFAGLHRANGDLIALTILVMVGCGVSAMRASSPIVRPSPSDSDDSTRHCGSARPASRSWAWNCCDTRWLARASRYAR